MSVLTIAREGEGGARAPACRLCGSVEVEWRGRKRGEFLRQEFDFYTCRDCGLLYVDPYVGQSIYDEAYYRGEGADPLVDYEAEYSDWRRTDRRLEFADLGRIADEHVAGTTGRGSVAWLDFGCGAGGLLKFLRQRGTVGGRAVELTGHDVGSFADRLARDDGFRILDYAALSAESEGRYDVVSMIEVIEHIAEPAAPVALVARLLKPGGLLLLTTGNLDSPIARRRGILYRYCTPETHVSLFNPRSLMHLYRSVGLDPIFVRYRGVVAFKVVKSLLPRPIMRAVARAALRFPPMVWMIDWLYGVSAMPCAVKPERTS